MKDDITITLSRDVFEDCLISVPGFRRAVMTAYEKLSNSQDITPELIHRGLLNILRSNLSSITSSGFNMIAIIKAIREDSRNGRMAHYIKAFPGFFTLCSPEAMGLAEAKKLAEHYVLHFGNQAK